VAVVPVLSGSGTRVKILEAWAAATAVVSTRLGAEGLAGRDGEHLLIADEAGDFASAVSKLLGSVEERERIAKAGRRLYEAEYTWEAGWEKLTDIKM
jgi:glycosyltransferase involved in cell wall biosynthesis